MTLAGESLRLAIFKEFDCVMSYQRRRRRRRQQQQQQLQERKKTRQSPLRLSTDRMSEVEANCFSLPRGFMTLGLLSTSELGLPPRAPLPNREVSTPRSPQSGRSCTSDAPSSTPTLTFFEGTARPLAFTSAAPPPHPTDGDELGRRRSLMGPLPAPLVFLSNLIRQNNQKRSRGRGHFSSATAD